MKSDWEPQLRRVECAQEELRRRLESLSLQIAALRARMGRESDGPVFEEWERPVSLPAEKAHPVPVVTAIEPPPLPAFDSVSAEQSGPEEPFPEHPSPAEAPVIMPEKAGGFELELGRYWLVRVGIVVLVTGFVLLGNLAYQNFIVLLGPAGKLGLLAAAGGLLAVAGAWMEKRWNSVRSYARVLMAGGAATVYYSGYAAHFVDRLRVIESPVIGGVLLLLLAGGFVGYACYRRSESTAFAALLLSFYTSAINPAHSFAPLSNAVLGLAAVVLLARQGWRGVSWLALAGSYAGFAYWHCVGGGNMSVSLGFLVAYWAIFTAAVFLRRGQTFAGGSREVFLTANNLAFFTLGAMLFSADAPAQFWIFCGLFSGALLSLSLLARVLRPAEEGFDGAYVAQGLLAGTLALVARFSGDQLGCLLVIESAALLYCSRFRHPTLLRVASALASIAAAAASALSLVLEGRGGWLAAGFTATVLCGNAILLKRGCREWSGKRWVWRAAGYAGLGLVVLGAILGKYFEGSPLVWALLAATAFCVVSLRLHRLPELVAGSHVFFALAACLVIPGLLSQNPDQGAVVPVLASGILLAHWWKWETYRPAALALPFEIFASATFAGTLFLWLIPMDSPVKLAAAALGISVYGAATRSWTLVATSPLFSLTGAVVGLWGLLAGGVGAVEGGFVFGLVAAQAGLGGFLFGATQPGILIQHRTAAAALAAAWIFVHLPGPTRFLALAALACAGFLTAARFSSREFLSYAGVLAAIGLGSFAREFLHGSPASVLDAAGFLIILVCERAGRRCFGIRFPGWMQNVLAAICLCGLWAVSTRWVLAGTWGGAVTVVWAALAFVSLGAGFLLRERSYRIAGLFILAVSVGHVFFVDVWKMGQVAGVLGIIVLAFVLLLLGFIYNRFAERLKKWL